MPLVSTCHTTGCPNDGIPIELATWTDETTGETVHADEVQCGACGQPVTDISDVT
jgi:hypothetical protein